MLSYKELFDLVLHGDISINEARRRAGLPLDTPQEKGPPMDQIPMEPVDLTQLPRNIVRSYVLTHLEKTDPLPDFEVYVVWFTKTLRNWKALVSTTLPGKMYYEVTYNGNRRETYIDAYLKVDNVCITDDAVEGYVDPSRKSGHGSFFDGLIPAGNDRHA